MIIQTGPKSFNTWKKHGSRWIGPCLVTEGCTGTMTISRGNMTARCSKCGKSKHVQLERQAKRTVAA
jgi:hypothetical protein